jgi:glycerol uptake facilitator protein
VERSAAAAHIEQRPPAAYIAEFIGTFVLVSAVTLAVCLFVNAQGTGSDWAVVGLVHFLVLFMLVQTIGSISGAHVNPAVTLALLALRKIRPNDAAVYILLQLAGAVAGALMTKFLLIDDLADQQAVGATSVNLSLLGSTFAGVIAEALGTFFLVWAVVAVAVNPRAARDWAGLVIGGTLGFAVFIFGPLTGAALNPARWFGPAFVDAIGENTTGFDDFWLYIIGPVAGGVLAALVYWYLFVEGPGIRAATPETGPKGLRQDVVPPQ